jgi:transcriptional regulator of arginine metabolism
VFPIGMVVAVEHNEMLIVVRTRVGRAPAVGIELDSLELDEVLGTIAGDDTVLVIPRAIALVEPLAAKLRELAEL